MEYKDYYKTLGLSRNASAKEIKQAFRKLARQYHPDMNTGDPETEAKFKEINEAYEVLGDSDKRAQYDQLGASWYQYQARDGDPRGFNRSVTVDAATILKRGENATFEVVAEEAILINLNTGTYYSLNKVGTEFWEMLDGEQTVQQHAEAIAAKYDVESDMVVKDLLEVAADLHREKLVETV